MLTSRRLGSSKQLKAAASNNPALSKGSKGEGVALIQDLLADLGYLLPKTLSSGKPDGDFGSETEVAVKDFQRKYDLRPDGSTGRLTLERLDRIVLAHNALETPPDGLCDTTDRLNKALPLHLRTRSAW